MSSNTQSTVETYVCSNCGATTTFDPRTKSLRCPFCGSEMAVRATGAGTAVPDGVAQLVLPFAVDKDAATQRIRDWLGGSFFAPRDLQSRSALDRGQGTYVPFWRFDALADSDWEGEVSQTRTRQVQRQFTTGDGKQETRLVDEQYKVWQPRSGTHQGRHRAWVCASTGLEQREADQLMPFPEEGMLTFSPDALAGFSAEEPGLDSAGGWVTGEQRIREMERDACAREVERLTRAETRLSEVASALCYLPVWLFGYRYDGKTYRVLVNGHTGEIVGDRPVSRNRVLLTIAAIVAVIAVIVVLVMLFRG